MLKIIGGLHRQRPLASPPGSSTRPTAGIVREAVFNICQTALEDARCLDLCAGSGAVGLEALSRGAAHVHFVDNSTPVCRCIKQNLITLALTTQATVLREEALSAVRQLAQQQLQFDLIYLDPPYRANKSWQGELRLLYHVLLAALDGHRLLANHGWLFVETDATAPSWPPLQQLELTSSRLYGSTQLHVFRNKIAD